MLQVWLLAEKSKKRAKLTSLATEFAGATPAGGSAATGGGQNQAEKCLRCGCTRGVDMHCIQGCQCETCLAPGCTFAYQSFQGDDAEGCSAGGDPRDWTLFCIVVLGIRLKRRNRVLQEVESMLHYIGEVKGEPFTFPALGFKVVVFASAHTAMGVERALELFNHQHNPEVSII